jgi:hypothetical protein
MSDHFEFLLRHANGKWISLIGQDDAVLPNIAHELSSVERHFPESRCIVTRRCYFSWPGVEEVHGGPVFIYLETKNRVVVNSHKRMISTLRGIHTYVSGPQLYTGSLIRNDLIEEIREKQGGRFFLGAIPDASSAASILMFLDHYIFSGRPCFIVGTSLASNGLASLAEGGKREEFESKAQEFRKKNAETGYVFSLRAGKGTIDALPIFFLDAFDNLLTKTNIMFSLGSYRKDKRMLMNCYGASWADTHGNPNVSKRNQDLAEIERLWVDAGFPSRLIRVKGRTWQVFRSLQVFFRRLSVLLIVPFSGKVLVKTVKSRGDLADIEAAIHLVSLPK